MVKTFKKPVVLYGSDTWGLTLKQMEKIEGWERMRVWSMLGGIIDNGSICRNYHKVQNTKEPTKMVRTFIYKGWAQKNTYKSYAHENNRKKC